MSNLIQEQKERVGRNIRTARLASKHSTLDGLAAVVGTSRQHLIKLEKGRHLPGDALLARIATATGRDEEWFSSASDDEEDRQPVNLADALLEVARVQVQMSKLLTEMQRERSAA